MKRLKTLFLLLIGIGTSVFAQTAVTVGSQVTDVAYIVSGKAYLLRWDGLTGTPYALDTGGSDYGMANNNSATQAAVYYFISDGNGGYKIENAYTGKYWPTPSSNNQAIAPTTAASAGTWTIAASGTANRFTLTCTVGATAYHTNRSSSKLVAHTSDSPVSIYEVTASTLATASSYSAFADKDISVSSTEAASISEGQWYVMSQRSRTSYVFENTSDHKFKHTLTKPSGSATEKAGYLVRLLSAGGGKYYLQNGFGNYMGAIAGSTNVPTTTVGQETITVAKISGTDGHFYLQGTTNGVILDGNDFSGGDPSTVVGWGTGAPTTTGGNNDWAFYPVEFVESWTPTTSEVYTINNTNPSRGALIYNPDANPNYVWSHGKSGTFDATQPNSQWVIIPTGTANQYYLYNVGAGKFAIPTGIGTGTDYPWVFSDDAVAVIFETQSDGRKKIKMATAPVSGTNNAYVSVSNGHVIPIFNYNDDGSVFTITKVTGDASTAANAAVAKLVKNQTALTSYPQTTGWYAIQIKSKDNTPSYAGRYLQNATSLYNDLYPLTFTGAIDVQPAITDPTFFTYIDHTSWDVNTWQLPDGRFLVNNGSNKFPTPSATAGNVICGYDNGNYFKEGNNYYADPYNSNANYFIGETTYKRTSYTVYPIDLTAAGLVAWKVICDNAPETAQITCSRSDVKGLTSVYKNGYFFLPTDVTPVESDFTLEGANGITIDATAKTITLAYDPNLAIVADGVTVEQGWQTAGRGGEVMLLKVTAAPFKAATNTSLTVSLKDGSEANISALKLYEASSNSPEILSAGNSGAPTKTEVATATISGSTATFNIGNLSAGTHYYWIGATVSSAATLGAVIDAAVTGISYQVTGQTAQNLDLTSVGDPADRGAMVFNVHSYPFLPRDNGSRVYRIPAMVVADDGSIVVACDKRYDSYTDIGNGHVIDIVIRRSTDGGQTWSAPVVIAKGQGSADNAKCGYGDPSLVKGKDGKLYCLFVAGNIGYFYGQQRIAMSTSTDNGVTWSSSESTPPIDLLETGRLKNYNTVGDAGYGLYDYFVTSGRGLYIPDDDILMYLIPAQTMTSATEHTSNSQDYIFYSRDGGESWYFSPQVMFAGGDEAKIIQKNDGSLLGSIRQGYNRGFNTATYTKNDDGKTLTFTMGSQWNNSQLSAGGYANNQDIFYYQRETVTGKTDVIFHSMTTGQHANFKLYYSTDGGANWTEFLTVQTKGTRYVTMERSGSEENPGSLYLFFEDQSLNSAGGYTDYNHYPLNFLEITREQLESLIPTLNDYNVPEYMESKDVKIVYGTDGEGTYGSWSGNTWTSNAASGVAGLTMTLSDGSHDKFSNYNSRYNMAYHPAAANTNSTITLTAPAGYVITGYSAQTGVYQAATYTLTVNGNQVTPANLGSDYTPIDISDLNTNSVVITVNTTDASKWLCLANFTVSLAKPLELKVVGDASYATLYLPFDVTTTGATKAYYIATASNGSAQLTETSDNGTEIPARTAVVLINSDADASTVLNMASGLTSVVSESANLLKGTLVPTPLNLGDSTPYYALGKNNDSIGFYKFDNNGTTTITLGANKAYLDTTAPSNSSKGFIFTFDDITGIISQESRVESQESNIWYTLDGRKLAGKPTAPGIYIVNKKKVLVK